MDEEIVRNIFLAGVQYGMQLHLLSNYYKAMLLYPTLKQDEEFVCLSGLVVMDGNENLSYFNSDNMPIVGIENV